MRWNRLTERLAQAGCYACLLAILAMLLVGPPA